MMVHDFLRCSVSIRVGRPLVVSLLAICATSARLLAQEYQSDPVDDKVAIRNRAIAQQCVKDAGIFAANTDKFLDYFNNYHFPAMTRTEPEKMAELGKLRDEIFRLYLWKSPNPELQRTLTEAAYKRMGQIVSKPIYHPAVRYNAIIVIGMLDDKYSPDGRQAPTPMARATKALTGLVDTATTGNTFPPSVILGAIIGLERHAQYSKNVPPDAVAGMSAALIKLINHDDPIQEMHRDAYAWMRLRAASALAKLGTVGPNNSNHNALIKLIASMKSLDDRCEVAGLLDKIVDYKNVKLDEAGTATPLFALVRDVTIDEDKRAGDFQSNYGAAPSGRGIPRGISPEGIGGANGEQETYPRRQVLARLTGVRKALKSVKPSLPTDTQKKVDEVVNAIDPGRDAVASKDVVELKLAETIRTMALAVNKVLPAPEKAPGDKKGAETL